MALDSFGLTLKQRLFCEHYMSNGGNATQAAISAGYCPDNYEAAGTMGQENMQKHAIKQYLKNKISYLVDKIGFDNEYVLKKLKLGVDIGLPELAEDGQIRADQIKGVDIKAAVACISERNKMLGVYAPEKHAMLVEEAKEGEVKGLIKEIEIKEY